MNKLGLSTFASFCMLVVMWSVAMAQEMAPAAPIVESGITSTVTGPFGVGLGLLLVMTTLNALKSWRRFADWALVNPVGRLLGALVLALLAAIPGAATMVSDGLPFGTVAERVGLIVLVHWVGAMGVNAGWGAVVNPKRDDLPPPSP